MLRLDKSSKTPLYEQIYDQFVVRIVNDIYAPGTRLPSIRDLAGSLQCSCNTVSAAYKLLLQEGFALSQPGSGFYTTTDEQFLERMKLESKSSEVLGSQNAESCAQGAHGIKGANSTGGAKGAYGAHGASGAHGTSGAHGASGASLAESQQPHDKNNAPIVFDFTYRDLEPGSFPQLEWKALSDDVLLSPLAVSCNFYTNSEGEYHLREAIARHIAVSRDIHCRPEQVIIQDGTQPALQNLLMLFDPSTDSIAMEDPGVCRYAIGVRAMRV